jgi:hypothetical protein
VRWATILEAVYVVLGSSSGGINRRIMLTHLLGEELRGVDTLCTRENFLTSHEHVIGVRKSRVGG